MPTCLPAHLLTPPRPQLSFCFLWMQGTWEMSGQHLHLPWQLQHPLRWGQPSRKPLGVLVVTLMPRFLGAHPVRRAQYNRSVYSELTGALSFFTPATSEIGLHWKLNLLLIPRGLEAPEGSWKRKSSTTMQGWGGPRELGLRVMLSSSAGSPARIQGSCDASQLCPALPIPAHVPSPGISLPPSP